MTIGERVTQLRTRRKMSQSALANASGVPLSVINMLEAGVRSGENLRVETARKLAKALVVTLDRLCGEGEDSERVPHHGRDGLGTCCHGGGDAPQMRHRCATDV